MQFPHTDSEHTEPVIQGRRYSQTKKVWLLCACLLLAGPLLSIAGIAWFAHAAAGTTDQGQGAQQAFAAKQPNGPVIPPAKGDQCVADTALMRTDHMDLLNHQRDETVIDGIRGNPFSLVDCVNCHAQTTADGTPIRIDAKGQFCQSCHAYAAVKIDCFTCHAALPETDSESAAATGHFDADLFDHNQLSVLAAAASDRLLSITSGPVTPGSIASGSIASGFIVSGSKDEHSTRD